MAYNYKKNNPYEEDEQNGVRNNKVSTPSYTYWDTWWASNVQRYTGEWVSGGGNFQYNSSINTNKLWNADMLFGSSAEQYESQNPWYLEKRNNAIANALYNEWKTDSASVENYLNTFSGYSNYDKAWQQNTVDAIMNRIGYNMNQQWNNNANNGYVNNANTMNAGMMNDMLNNYNNYKNGYSNLMWWSNYPSNFDEAVLNKLKTAYWIESLDEFKQRYPEQYDSLMQSLETVRPVRDATNPTQRQMLDWQLQWIIGTWVGAWSDWSKLNVLESSIMNKFENPEQIKQDAQNILKLQTEWRSIPEIAERMWMSEDQVQQLVLLANGLDSKAWEYYKLNDKSAKDITEPYDTKLERARIEKDIALERANRQVERLKQDFDTNMERQQKANEVNLHNADFLSWQYGYWFSKRGIEWLQYTAQQAQNIIDDLCRNYDRNSQQLADWIADIIRNWERYNEDITKASEDALTQAKNNYTSNMLAIQQKYWTVGLQAQQQLSNNVQSFITTAEDIYDNMLQQQQQNLTNLITNASNLNALSMQNLTLRQAKIEQFQNESLNLNRNQLQNLADQLWMDKETYQDLVNYQVQAVANQLNGYIPWAWVQMQSQIQSLLDQWYSPNQAMQMIMNSADFQAMQSAGWDNSWSGEWKVTWDYMYNTSTWERQNLAWGGGTVSTTNPDTWAYQKVKLGETPNVDTWIKNVYGSTVKLAPTVWAMFSEAYNTLAAKWIELKVWDSYRSYETQKKAYESWKAWVVAPWTSYHELWQAFDVVQDGSMYTDEVVQALLDAGFTRPNAKEPRHWSYGEWKDAFGGQPRNTEAYNMARSILDGVGTLPSKNSKEYQPTVNALYDLKKQIYWEWYPEWEALINYSVVFDNNLAQSTVDKISGTMQSIYSTDTLMKTLEENEYKTWPIISKLAKLNSRDADYAAISASINQMASNIARWFWEKWVLTDKDIERYMQTIPNEKMGNKARDVVGTLLKAKLYDWLIATIESEAKNKKDVSMYLWEYREAINWLQQNWFRDRGWRWNLGGWWSMTWWWGRG